MSGSRRLLGRYSIGGALLNAIVTFGYFHSTQFDNLGSNEYSISCGSSPGDHPIGRIDIGPVEVVLPSKHIALWSEGKVVITAGDLRVEGYDCKCLKKQKYSL